MKEWNGATSLLMLALTRPEWTLLVFFCELFYYAWGQTESGLKILDPRPFNTWVEARFDDSARHAPFFPPPRRILFAVLQRMLPCEV